MSDESKNNNVAEESMENVSELSGTDALEIGEDKKTDNVENQKNTKDDSKSKKNIVMAIVILILLAAAIAGIAIGINKKKSENSYTGGKAPVASDHKAEMADDAELTPTESPVTKEPEETPSPTPEETPVPEPTEVPAETPAEGNNQGGSEGGSDVHGALSVKGTQLVDASGNPIQLKGVSTHGLQWFPDYVNYDAFKSLRDEWGCNVVRLAMYTHEGGYCSGADKTKLKTLIDNGVSYATQLNMYVIIDWHVLNEGSPMTYKNEAVSFFDEVSKKYSTQNNVIYEICNEPCNGASWATIKQYAEEIIPVIKANDPDAVIIVGTPEWSQRVDEAAANPINGYSNIMYALHFYAATHTDWLRERMTSAVDAGLPVFVSEYGICDASGNGGCDISQANEWVKTMDKYGISYVCWNLANKNESSSLINSSVTKKSGWTYDELSQEGKWLVDMLGGKISKGSSGAYKSDTSAPQALDNPNAGTGNAGGNNNSDNSSNGGTVSGNGNSGSGGNSSSSGNNNGNASSENVSKGGTAEVTVNPSGSWTEGDKNVQQYSLSYKNVTGGDINRWKITIKFSGNIESDINGWNAKFTVSGDTLTITPNDEEEWATKIPANGEIASIGFSIKSSSAVSVVSSVISY